MRKNILKIALCSTFLFGLAYSAEGVAQDAKEAPVAEQVAADLSEFYSQEVKDANTYQVPLYGSDFTLNTFLASRDNWKWEDVGYLIPTLFPGIEGKKDQRNILDMISTLEDAQDGYRGLYETELGRVAARLEKDGHLALAGEYDSAPLPIFGNSNEQEPTEFVEDSPARRVAHIEVYLRDALNDKTLSADVQRYNDAQEKSDKATVALEAFANLELFHQYAYAAYGLKTMVMASDEVRLYVHTNGL